MSACVRNVPDIGFTERVFLSYKKSFPCNPPQTSLAREEKTPEEYNIRLSVELKSPVVKKLPGAVLHHLVIDTALMEQEND